MWSKKILCSWISFVNGLSLAVLPWLLLRGITDAPWNFLITILFAIDLQLYNNPFKILFKIFCMVNFCDLNYFISKRRNYLVGKCFKDCSLFIDIISITNLGSDRDAHPCDEKLLCSSSIYQSVWWKITAWLINIHFEHAKCHTFSLKFCENTIFHDVCSTKELIHFTDSYVNYFNMLIILTLYYYANIFSQVKLVNHALHISICLVKLHLFDSSVDVKKRYFLFVRRQKQKSMEDLKELNM